MTLSQRLTRPELELGRHSHGVVTYDELRAAGLSKAAIGHLVDAQRIHEIHYHVFAVGRPALSRRGRWLAAVRACGDRGALGFVPAGLNWRILERGDERPHVVVPTQAGVEAPLGVKLCRAATLTAADVVSLEGIPTTSLHRTLVDLAGVLAPDRLRSAVRQAVRHHELDLRGLRDAVQEPRNDGRRARIRRVIDLYVPREDLTESELEARFLELLFRRRLPMPTMQRRRGRHRVDFIWEDLRLVVETDGAEWHGTLVGRHDDRVKERRLRAAGYEVLRFSWAEVVNDPAGVARELREAIARRRAVVAQSG